MKITDLLKHTRVDEAPLGDYQTIGNWGDKEKASSFAQKADRSMIQNPTAIRKAHEKFGRTEHILNLYFVNLPGLRKYSESGVMEPEQIAQAMPKAWPEIEARGRDGVDHKNGINVIFVSNTGFKRMPMTPWIMAHRIGHAIQTTNRMAKHSYWNDYEEDASEFFSNLLEGVYDWSVPRQDIFTGGGEQDKLMAKFFEGIGGMRSARKGQLGGRPYEFLYEMFAQFVTQGKLTFRPLPQRFGVRFGTYEIQDQDTADMWTRDLNDGVGDHLGSRIDNTLYGMEGKFLVM
jgi:hypothetical protein